MKPHGRYADSPCPGVRPRRSRFERGRARLEARAGAILALFFAALATVSPLDARSRGPVDLALEFQVVWGDDSLGPESLRDQVERFVLQRLEQARCYASVRRASDPARTDVSPAPDLRFRVTLSDLDEHEKWDVSIAERTAPDQDPHESETKVEATIEFDVAMVLDTMPGGIRVRDRAYRETFSYRPKGGEDPREEARRAVLEEFAREATGFACKHAEKLPREIERARAAARD